MNTRLSLFVLIMALIVAACTNMKNQPEFIEMQGTAERVRPSDVRYDMDDIAHSYDVVEFLVAMPEELSGRRIEIAIPAEGSQIHEIMARANPSARNDWDTLRSAPREIVFQVRSDAVDYYFNSAKKGGTLQLLYANSIKGVRQIKPKTSGLDP